MHFIIILFDPCDVWINNIYLPGWVVDIGKPMCLNIWLSSKLLLEKLVTYLWMLQGEYSRFSNLNIHSRILSLL